MKVMTLDIMISNELRQYITDHHLKFGDKLPSERELCELFSIQRLTLRSAMKIWKRWELFTLFLRLVILLPNSGL